MPAERSIIAGSEREPVEGAHRIGDPPADRRIEVTLTLRRRSGEKPPPSTGAARLTRAELAERYGANPADVKAVERFATENGLEVVRASIPDRIVVLAGTIADMSRAFGVELGLYEHPGLGRFRGRTGEITVPSEIAAAVTGVLGLDDRPAARPGG